MFIIRGSHKRGECGGVFCGQKAYFMAMNGDVLAEPKHMARQFIANFPQGGIDQRTARLLRIFSSEAKDVYQFGVFTGNGLRKLASAVGGRVGHVWGFDSFQGIPRESQEEVDSWRDGRGNRKSHFLEGGYSAAAALGNNNITNNNTRRGSKFSP